MAPSMTTPPPPRRALSLSVRCCSAGDQISECMLALGEIVWRGKPAHIFSLASQGNCERRRGFTSVLGWRGETG